MKRLFGLGLLCALTACSSSDGNNSDDGTNGVGSGDAGGSGGSGGGGSMATGEAPPDEFIPSPTGTCPGFVEGDGCVNDGTSLVCTFHPAGVTSPRQARIWIEDVDAEAPAPVVFYFHGLTRNAGDAVLPLAGFGPDVTQSILDAGGLLIAMEKDESLAVSDFPWISGLSYNGEDDFLVMDEILACAIEKVGVDLSHIHVTGMSAGGLQTGASVSKRSGWIASATTFSGGQPSDFDNQDPENKLPVMLVHGGPNDIVILNFMDQSVAFQQELEAQGHFTFICNHGSGHIVDPPAAAAAWQFFQDHPYGEASPYAGGLPASFPAYCEL